MKIIRLLCVLGLVAAMGLAVLAVSTKKSVLVAAVDVAADDGYASGR
jgi:hypothetical protein